MEPVWLQQERESARKAYVGLQWPNLRYGLTMRMDYSDLSPEVVEACISQQTPHHTTIECADENVIVMPLKEAIEKHPELVQTYLFKIMTMPNKFAEFHRAFWSSGTFVYIPAQVEVEDPIVIRKSLTGSNINHTLIVADDASAATIIEIADGQQNGPLFVSNATEIIAKANSSVRFISTQNYPQNVFHFDYKNAEIDQDAQVHWHDCCLGSAFTLSTIHSLLNGIGSESTIKNMFLGSNKQRFDIGAQIVHGASHTHGNIETKGILMDSAKNMYRGLIRIERDAPSSKGYQKEDVLMLSPEAEANSIPQLEIENNDVKCSHAATTTHVDKERLFYLMARGISETTARKTFVRGFIEPFIQQLGSPVTAFIEDHIEQRLV